MRAQIESCMFKLRLYLHDFQSEVQFGRIEIFPSWITLQKLLVKVVLLWKLNWQS